jgi:hypothetical protein
LPFQKKKTGFADKHIDSQLDLFNSAHTKTAFENIENASELNGGKQGGDNRLHAKPESVNDEAIFEKIAKTKASVFRGLKNYFYKGVYIEKLIL